MSGTAALAAARKRRANPQMPQGNVNTSSNINSTSKPLNSIEEIPKATNPAMLLMQHNMLIQRLHKEVAELKEYKESESKTKSKDSEINYKTEYLGLLEEMKEMKKVLLKVQSFSMETNLEVMKLKRISLHNSDESKPVNASLNESLNGTINGSLKIDLSSITETNDIDDTINRM
jgi:hypothetical protein